MMYRLITVFHDEENDQNPITRGGYDFATPEDAEAHVAHVVAAGVTSFVVSEPPMENGAHLRSVCIPTNKIIGWYIWELPDDTPPLQSRRLVLRVPPTVEEAQG